MDALTRRYILTIVDLDNQIEHLQKRRQALSKVLAALLSPVPTGTILRSKDCPDRVHVVTDMYMDNARAQTFRLVVSFPFGGRFDNLRFSGYIGSEYLNSYDVIGQMLPGTF